MTIDTLRCETYPKFSMNVPLNPDLQEKLLRLAAKQGRDSEALVVEAVERMVNYGEL